MCATVAETGGFAQWATHVNDPSCNRYNYDCMEASRFDLSRRLFPVERKKRTDNSMTQLPPQAAVMSTAPAASFPQHAADLAVAGG